MAGSHGPIFHLVRQPQQSKCGPRAVATVAGYAEGGAISALALRYHPAMLDSIDIEFDPPDADTVYEGYLETCRRLGVEPVSRDRAQGLIEEWNEVLSGRGLPTTH